MPGARSPSTVDLADAAAQAVRELNHRTLHSAALSGPAQLDRIVAELAVMVAGLPQLLRQLGHWLTAEQHAGRIRSDNHLDPGRIVDQAIADLADGGHTARRLGQLLDAAHQHTAHLGAQPHDDRATTAAAGRPTTPADTDRAGTVATSGHNRGHRRAGLMAADGQISMSLDTPPSGRRGSASADCRVW